MATQTQTLPTVSDQATVQQLVNQVYQRAAALANEGKSKPKIQTELQSMGLNQESASIMVEKVFRLRKKAYREAGARNILVGALWCVGGTVFTAWTYQMASHGGVYFVASGAILFGGIQFLRGLGQVVFNLF